MSAERRFVGTYKMADRIVRIESFYPLIHEYCKGYEWPAAGSPASAPKALSLGTSNAISTAVAAAASVIHAVASVSSGAEGCDASSVLQAADTPDPESSCAAPAPDIFVSTTPEDIAYEREHATEDMVFSDDYFEELAVHRKISTAMVQYDTFLFHGSCVAVDGEGYLFTAPSGTGKSTHARLWREYLGERAVMINDDKPFIRIASATADAGAGCAEENPAFGQPQKNASASGPAADTDPAPIGSPSGSSASTAAAPRAFIYGTPFNGKHRLGTNICVPLKAICILSRGEKNEITKIEPQAAYTELLQQTYRPHDPALLAKTMELLDQLTFSVGLYKLKCNMDPEAARVSYEGMNGK